MWVKSSTLKVLIEAKEFASGAFRDAFLAKPTGENPVHLSVSDWVVKKYKETAIPTIINDLKMSVEDHTRKQVQMHAVARNVTQRFTLKVPVEFGDSFQYGKVFYSQLDDVPVTVEEYVPGEFMKYVNNDGKCLESHSDDPELVQVFEKAQCLAHFSYIFSEEKLMVVDLQGSMYHLYDPEIATKDWEDLTGEYYFCAGNLSVVSIEEFKKQHNKCSKYCRMLELEEFSGSKIMD